MAGQVISCKFRLRWLLNCWILLFASATLPGQSRIPYQRFGPADGLPSSEVYKVEVDRRGRIWLATDRGLAVYDGYHFQVLGPGDGLANATVLKMYQDPGGGLWFAGIDGSLSQWKDAVLSPSPWNDALKAHLAGHRWIQQMVMDESGHLLVSSRHRSKQEYFLLEPEATEVQAIEWEVLSKRYPGWQMGTQEILKVGQGFFCNWPGIAPSFDPVQQFLFYSPSVRSAEVRVFDVASGQLRDPLQLPSAVLALYRSQKGDLWIGTRQGLHCLPGGDVRAPLRSYLPGVPVSALREDREGNFWVTTLSGGVIFVRSFDYEILPLDDNSEGLPFSLLPWQDHLLLSTQDGVFYALDSTFTPQFLHRDASAFGTYTLPVQHQGIAWFGTHRFDIFQNKVRHQHFPQPKFYRYQPLTLSDGRQLIIKYRGYLLLDSLGKQLYDTEAYFAQGIMSILEWEGELWIGTASGLYHCAAGSYHLPQPVFEDYPPLQCRVNAIRTDAKGNLWIGTLGAGVFHLAPDRGILQQFDQDRGLSSDFVNDLYVLGDTGVLIATNRGLSTLYYETDPSFRFRRIQTLDVEDGLAGNYIRKVSAWKGRIWLVTDQGLNHFPVDRLSPPTGSPPLIQVEEVRANTRPIDSRDAFSLRYDQNDLSFHFLGIAHRKPRKLPFYRFRLLRRDQDSSWSYTNARSARFYNLAPGNYRFEVAARNPLGQWSPSPAVYDFEIHPHFSQTRWFQYLLVALLLASIGMAFGLFRRRLRRRELERMRLDEARMQAQEAEIAALRKQINPHFVFNVLNSIQHYYFKHDLENANRYMVMFSRLMRDGLRFSRSQRIPLNREIQFLTRYLELEKMRFPERFAYRLEIDPAIETSLILVPPFLFQPILENAVKHAFKDITYPGLLRLEMQLREEEDLLWVRISDNGPGWAAQSDLPSGQDEHQSLGLKLVANQMALLQKEAPQARFELRNLSEAEATATGLEAIFHIPIMEST